MKDFWLTNPDVEMPAYTHMKRPHRGVSHPLLMPPLPQKPDNPLKDKGEKDSLDTQDVPGLIGLVDGE